MVSRGKTSQEIADNLRISEVTVKWHVGNSMRKLGAASRAEAVAIALRQGIL
jgi:DNA-binding CsgD family transcriptional regulator